MHKNQNPVDSTANIDFTSGYTKKFSQENIRTLHYKWILVNSTTGNDFRRFELLQISIHVAEKKAGKENEKREKKRKEKGKDHKKD